MSQSDIYLTNIPLSGHSTSDAWRAPGTVNARWLYKRGPDGPVEHEHLAKHTFFVISTSSRNNMSKKVIAVVGATGRQGGGTVDVLLKDGTFAVRAITRDAGSDKAKGRSTTNVY